MNPPLQPRTRRPVHWIGPALAAHSTPGALHRQMHVPVSQPIPLAALKSAAHSPDPLKARRARLALTLRGLH